MKKIVPFLFFAVTGCSVPGGVVDVVNPLNFFETGFYPLLIVAELETNLSSVVIDKTKAKVEDFSANPYEILPEGSAIYVMPVKIKQASKQGWDNYYSQMITNYIKMNNFASVTNDLETADYVLTADISESPEVWHGKNYSHINMTIMEKNENPVFYTKVNVISKSDRNFYYHPSKSARPVKELTLVGLETIFRDGLPQAFGTDEES